MKLFLVALQFLTILPVKIKAQIKESDFGRALVYFPIVGMLIGVLLVLVLFLFTSLPISVASVFILIVSIIVTGGIHLDGFADTCDGLYGFKTKDKALEIMRDSHLGAMGVIGIVMLLLLKFTLLMSIPQSTLWRSLILMAIFARWIQVLSCFLSNYARKEGKAKYFIEYAGKKEILISMLFTVAFFLLLMKVEGFILFLISLLTMLPFINYIKKKIGGMTGDTIGAASEIAEVLVLLFSLIIAKINI